MKVAKGIVVWGALVTEVVLFVSCPANSLLNDVQQQVDKARNGTPRASTPQFSPAAGTFNNPQTVTIKTTSSGASIRYTTDGSMPTATAGALYTGPIAVGETFTIKAIAHEAGFADSEVSVATYTIGPPAQLARTLTAGNVNAQFSGVATDSSGNIYAAGSCDGTGIYGFGGGVTAAGSASNNVLLVRYSSWGQAQWAATLHGGSPSACFDSAAVDSIGNVIAAGYSTGTGTYDFGNGATATGDSANFNVLLVKYGNTQSSAWATWAQTSTGGLIAQFFGVAVDSSDNIYAAGKMFFGTVSLGNGVTATGAAPGSNVLLVKYNSSGLAQWARTLTAAAGSTVAFFSGIKLDSTGNIYAAGRIYGGGTVSFGNGVNATGVWTGNNVLLVKYDSSGLAQWAQTLTAGNGDAWYNGITTDSAGSVYAAGTVYGNGTYGFGNAVTASASAHGIGSYNLLLVKYNSSGQAQWAKTTTLGDSSTFYHGVAADSSGNIYAAGSCDYTGTYGFGNGVTASATGASLGTNVILVKYNSAGQAQWAHTLTAGNSDAIFEGVAVDSSSNIYALGYSSGVGAYGFGNGVTAAGTCTGYNVLLLEY